MAKYGMAIDLDNCIGCGACAMACKTENNTSFETNSKKFNWADFLTFTKGTFAAGDVTFQVMPVLCNHCTDAPCVTGCPVTPTAMYKSDTGITLHNDERCIGCKLCQENCPYSEQDVDSGDAQYSVISYNPDGVPTHGFYADETSLIQNGTSTPKEVATLVGVTPPDMNDYTHADYNAVRPANVTEKCIFCDHRVLVGEQPYCVVSCPSGARIFGDLDDPGSDVSLAIANGYARLKDNSGEFLATGEAGTIPNVFYIGGGVPTGIKRKEVEIPAEVFSVFPNPAVDQATVEFGLTKPEDVTIEVYSITGKMVMSVLKDQPQGVGKNRVDMSVTDLSSGTYIIRLSYGKSVSTANMVVTR